MNTLQIFKYAFRFIRWEQIEIITSVLLSLRIYMDNAENSKRQFISYFFFYQDFWKGRKISFKMVQRPILYELNCKNWKRKEKKKQKKKKETKIKRKQWEKKDKKHKTKEK